MALAAGAVSVTVCVCVIACVAAAVGVGAVVGVGATVAGAGAGVITCAVQPASTKGKTIQTHRWKNDRTFILVSFSFAPVFSAAIFL